MGKKKVSTHGGARKGAGRKPRAEGKAVVLTVSVPEPVVDGLDAYVEARESNRSAVVTEAIRKLVGTASKRKPKTDH